MLLRCAAFITSVLAAAVNAEAADSRIFIDGGRLVGGTNGVIFDYNNELHACQSLGRQISKVDPETGDILSSIGPEEEVFTPDDAVFLPDGTMIWSEFILGTFMMRPPGGPTEMLYPPFTYPNANPLALSDDNTRLFFGQCFNEVSLNGIYERNLLTNETTIIIEGIPSCSSNSMAFKEDALYTPRLYEGRVVKIDLANNNTVTNVSTGLGIPNAVKFSRTGELYGTDSQFGKVYRYDLANTDTENNREVVFHGPFNAIDNLIFDNNNRLYISSVNRGTVLEVFPDTMDTDAGELMTQRDGTIGSYRTVVPGTFTLPCGVAVLDGVVYLVHPNGAMGFDAVTGEEVLFFEPVIGFDSLEQPSAVAAWEEKGLLLFPSLLTATLSLFDPSDESLEVLHFTAPVADAHPHGDDILVVDATGNITLVKGSNYEEKEVISTVPGVFFLAGSDQDVYASNYFTGTILQIIENGKVLEEPKVISTGHSAPEGIALYGGDSLLVVCSGTGTLEHVVLETGAVTVLENNLSFQAPADILPYGWPNDVAIHGDNAFVNGDGVNAIYRFELSGANTPEGEKLDGTALEPAESPGEEEAPSSWGLKRFEPTSPFLSIWIVVAILV